MLKIPPVVFLHWQVKNVCSEKGLLCMLTHWHGLPGHLKEWSYCFNIIGHICAFPAFCFFLEQQVCVSVPCWISKSLPWLSLLTLTVSQIARSPLNWPPKNCSLNTKLSQRENHSWENNLWILLNILLDCSFVSFLFSIVPFLHLVLYFTPLSSEQQLYHWKSKPTFWHNKSSSDRCDHPRYHPRVQRPLTERVQLGGFCLIPRQLRIIQRID